VPIIGQLYNGKHDEEEEVEVVENLPAPGYQGEGVYQGETRSKTKLSSREERGWSR